MNGCRLAAAALLTLTAAATQAAAFRAVLLVPADDPRLTRSRLERGVPGHPSGPAADAVTVAPHAVPAFTQPWKSGDRIAKAGTLLGHDDGEPVTTPYDNCVLVMPSINRPLRAGVTVVRLGRLT